MNALPSFWTLIQTRGRVFFFYLNQVFCYFIYFESSSTIDTWDGIKNGALAPEGTYDVSINITMASEDKLTLDWTICIIRDASCLDIPSEVNCIFSDQIDPAFIWGGVSGGVAIKGTSEDICP